MTAYETYGGAALGVVSLVDSFAQARGTRGLMPVPIPPLQFSLVARMEQGNTIPLDPPLTLYAQSGTSGAYLFADEARIGNSPLVRIPPATYELRIESDNYLTLQTPVDWPPSPASLPVLSLLPGYAYPFPDVTVPTARLTLLRGMVLAEVTGAPVADAVVEIIDPPNLGAFASTQSDARGAWVLAFTPPDPPPATAHVRITLPGGSGVIDVPNVALAGADNSLPQTALRGSVLTMSGARIPNAEITVDALPGQSVRTGRDGGWTFYFGLNQPSGAARVTARAPSGQSQDQDVRIVNRATVVVPTFRIA